jgi:hypothetical protein
MTYTDQVNDYISKKLITPDKHPALYDYQFQVNLSDAPWNEWLSKPNYFDVYDEYIDTFVKWITSTKNNTVIGLEKFKFIDVVVGTTQTFDEAYYRYRGRQLRTFAHEYAYHSRNVNVQHVSYASGISQLDKNDWAIVSMPFSGTGGVNNDYNALLLDAESKNVPVLVDCAWFGTCRNINFDFSHPAVQEVTFSLSKGIGLGNMRTGLRFSNYTDGSIRQQNNYKHLVFSNMQLGIWQMNKFTPDFVTDKYLDSYKNMCDSLNMVQTKCMHVAQHNGKLLGVRNLVKEYYKNERTYN